MNKLLVASVYVDHVRSKDWYSLQKKYLSHTTFDYDYLIYLNGSENFYDPAHILYKNTSFFSTGQEAHIRGMNFIVDYFTSKNNYEYLLILDSDAFPIKKWQLDLCNSMHHFDAAAIVRYENLDTFAHPSVFFVNRKIATDLQFDRYPQKDRKSTRLNSSHT